MVAVTKLFLTVTAIAGLAQADWQLTLNYANGKQVVAHGSGNSGCKKLDVTDSKISTFTLEGSLLVDTVELYTDTGCSEGKYTKGTGSHNPTDTAFRSYKTY